MLSSLLCQGAGKKRAGAAEPPPPAKKARKEAAISNAAGQGGRTILKTPVTAWPRA